MLKTEELFDLSHTAAKDLFISAEEPYSALKMIKEGIEKIAKNGEYSEFLPGVFVAEGVKIAETATVLGPTLIGKNTEIRPGAYIRGSAIIGEECVIGNSTEIKNAIIFDGVQIPHYNYVGDSILGYKSHMGAGAIASNFRLDHANIVIKDGDRKIETGLRKLGVLLGDFAEVGCGSVLSPGTVIGRKTIVYPLSHVVGVVAGGQIFKDGRVKPRIDERD